MQDQIVELAARLTSAATEDEIRSVDLAIYHLREDRKRQHRLFSNMLLAQIASLKELHNTEDEKLHALGEQAEAKLEELEPKQGESA